MEAGNNGNDLVASVRSGDYERFLAIQLAPADKRPALYVITACHIEVASIAEMVSEALIGHIRLAWWREALEEIEAGKTPRSHPVVLALADVYARHPRVFAFLYEMIDVRAADLDESLIADEAAWQEYCNHTAGALHMAFATVVSEACAREQESMIRAEGKAYAMIGLARAIPFMTSQGFVRFPQARLMKHHLTSLAPSESLNHFVQEIFVDAEAMMRKDMHNLRLPILNAMVVLALLGKHQLERVSGNPYLLRPAKLRPAWRMVLLKYCPFTCF